MPWEGRSTYPAAGPGVNPPASRALGRLFVEVKVAPVRPAEFIVVRIALFDGEAEITEG